MRIIPVIDILNGVTVHAVKGKRTKYKPLKSVLCNSTDAIAVASAFRSLGFGDLYVADLDAITGKGENLATMRQVVEDMGLKLMVDAGVCGQEQAKELLQCGVTRVIVGTETLPSLSHLSLLLQSLGTDKVVVSLDLKDGKVLSKSLAIASMGVVELARRLEEMGVLEVIVLDLARVGSGEGVDAALLEKLVHELKIKVDVGGGVRGIDDLLTLKRLGVQAVLLATALHQGKITIEDLRNSGLLD